MERTQKEKFYYSIGHIVFGIHELCFGYFFLFFYTSVIGISPAIVGSAIFISLLFDAFNDPLIGRYSDLFRSKKWGQRTGLMLFSLPLLSIGLMLSFNPPEALSEIGLIIWMFICIIFTRTALSLFFIPYLALGVDLCSDYVERSELSAWRHASSYIIVLILAAFFVAVILADSIVFPDGRLNRQGYNQIGWIASLASMFFGLFCIFKMRFIIPYSTSIYSKKQSLFSLKSINLVLKSKNLKITILILSLLSVLSGLIASLFFYIYSDFWLLSQEQIGLLNLTTFLIIFPAFLCAKFITAWCGKKVGLVTSIVGFAVAFVVPIVAHILGAFDLLAIIWIEVLIFASFAIIQFFVISASILQDSIIADVTDEVQNHYGEAQKGLVFGIISICKKSGLGLGGLIGGLILQISKQSIPMGSSSKVELNIDFIALLCVVIVVVLVSLFVFYTRNYSLTQTQVQELQQNFR